MSLEDSQGNKLTDIKVVTLRVNIRSDVSKLQQIKKK